MKQSQSRLRFRLWACLIGSLVVFFLCLAVFLSPAEKDIAPVPAPLGLGHGSS